MEGTARTPRRISALPRHLAAPPYYPAMPLSERGRGILLWGFAAVGYALLARVLLVEGIAEAGGIGAIDANAYWSAAGHAWRGESLYDVGAFTFRAYQYPPVFAQALAPGSLLPLPVFVWIWRSIELLGLRLATGGWARAGIALLVFPPVIAEVDAGNVHLIIAGVTALAMRGIAWPVGPAFLAKFSTWPLAPILWRHDRWRLILGIAGAAVVCGVSIVLTPDAWREYLAFLANHTLAPESSKVLSDVPLALRLTVAGLIGLAATRWIRLAPIAVTLAYPIVWVNALSTLTALVAPVSPRVLDEPKSEAPH